MQETPKITVFSKAIRAKCLECSAGSAFEVRNCPVKSCPLWPFRFGKNPYHKKRKGNPEALRKAREARKAANDHITRS